MVFIGPPADVIERMGSKIAARELMERAGVPVVPGVTPADQSDDGITAAVKAIGYPVLIKASAGGGGKGMRTVCGRREAARGDPVGPPRGGVGVRRRHALRRAARSSGRGTSRSRFLADAHGDVMHLFERECSLQRRHQKVIEESPSPALTSSRARANG